MAEQLSYNDLENITKLDLDLLNISGNLYVGGTTTLGGLNPKGVLALDGVGNITSNILTNGQLLIGHTLAVPVPGSIVGVNSNQITPSFVSPNILLSLPQDIGTASTPTFAGMNTAGSIIPTIATSYDLGTALLPFRDIYGTLTPTGDFLPALDNTYSLGSLAKRWKNIFISGQARFDNLTVTRLVATDASDQLQSVTITPTNNLNLSFSGSTLAGSVSLTPSFTSVSAGSFTDTGLASSLVSTTAGGVLQNTTVNFTQANGNTSTLGFSGSTLTGAFTMSQDLSTSGGPIFHNLGTIAGVYSDWFGNTDNTWNLGLPTKRWKTLYVAGISQFDILGATALVASDLNKQLQSVTITPTNNLNLSFSGSTLAGSVSLTPSFTSITTGSFTDTGLASSLVSTTAGGLLQNTTVSYTQANGNTSTLGFSGSTLTGAFTNSQDLSSGGNVTFNHLGVTNGNIELASIFEITYAANVFTLTNLATTWLTMDTSKATFANPVYSTTANLSNLTASRMVLTDGSKNLISLGNMTDGQVILGSSIGAPAPASIVAGNGITLTTGHNSLTIGADGIFSNLSASCLVATDASKDLVSVTSLSNSNGCNFSLAANGATLTATMTQDVSTSGSPTFTDITTTGTGFDHLSNGVIPNAHILMGEAATNCFLHVGSPVSVNTGPTVSRIFIGNLNSLAGGHGGQIWMYSSAANVNGALAAIGHSSTSGTSNFNFPDIGNTTTRDLLHTGGGQTIVGAETISNTTDSSSTATGCLILSGGLGCAKKAYFGDEVHATLTTDASSTSTGSLQTLGGIGCSKKLYVGTSIFQAGNQVLDVTYLPKRATMWHDDSIVTHGNAITIVINGTSCYYAVVCYQNLPANGDKFTQGFSVQAGTYTLKVMGHVATNNGIQQWAIDGVNVGATIDWYNAGGFVATTRTFSLGALTAGYHTLTSTITGKNVGSTDFFLQLTKMSIYQAAD